MLSETATRLAQPPGLPAEPSSESVADQIVRDRLFRLLGAHEFEDALALLDRHPDLINAVDEDGTDVIRYAIFANNAGVVHRLAERGADLDRRDRGGWNTVMEAAHLGFASILQVLLAHRADLHSKTPFGWTPVQLALMQGHSKAARVLIIAGANLNDGPMRGMYARDLIDGIALDPDVVRLVRKRSRPEATRAKRDVIADR